MLENTLRQEEGFRISHATPAFMPVDGTSALSPESIDVVATDGQSAIVPANTLYWITEEAPQKYGFKVTVGLPVGIAQTEAMTLSYGIRRYGVRAFIANPSQDDEGKRKNADTSQIMGLLGLKASHGTELVGHVLGAKARTAAEYLCSYLAGNMPDHDYEDHLREVGL